MPKEITAENCSSKKMYTKATSEENLSNQLFNPDKIEEKNILTLLNEAKCH